MIMSVIIGHSSIDENGKISGGKAGDQTTKEVCTRSFYMHSKGWVVLRPVNETLLFNIIFIAFNGTFNVSHCRVCVCVYLLSHVRISVTHRPRILCSWNFPGKNTGPHCHFLLQGIFLTQGSNSGLLHLLHWQVDSLPLHHLGSLKIMISPFTKMILT